MVVRSNRALKQSGQAFIPNLNQILTFSSFFLEVSFLQEVGEVLWLSLGASVYVCRLALLGFRCGKTLDLGQSRATAVVPWGPRWFESQQ